MEKLDLQEQQSDRQELEETLVKMETHKEKLIQQIKTIRQLCYNESQKVLIHPMCISELLHLHTFN